MRVNCGCQTAEWMQAVLPIVSLVLGCDVVKDTWAAVALVLQGRVVIVQVNVELLLNIRWHQVRNA